MSALRCEITVTAGIIPGEAIEQRTWEFTRQDLDNPPDYIDRTGAAMNYAMSLQNPGKYNWVEFKWIWY